MSIASGPTVLTLGLINNFLSLYMTLSRNTYGLFSHRLETSLERSRKPKTWNGLPYVSFVVKHVLFRFQYKGHVQRSALI